MGCRVLFIQMGSGRGEMCGRGFERRVRSGGATLPREQNNPARLEGERTTG